MLRAKLASVVVALAASTAMAAGPLNQFMESASEKTFSQPYNYSDSPTPHLGVDCVVDVSGTPSLDGSSAIATTNAFLVIDVAACVGLPSGTPVTMNGVGWDVNLFADAAVGPFGGSWLSEPGIRFSAGAAAPAAPFFNLFPGSTDAPGTENFTSGGTVKLTDALLPDLILPTGVLRMSFYEGFDDAAGVVDGGWLAGSSITVQVVPEPGSLALLVVGAGLALRRRR